MTPLQTLKIIESVDWDWVTRAINSGVWGSDLSGVFGVGIDVWNNMLFTMDLSILKSKPTKTEQKLAKITKNLRTLRVNFMITTATMARTESDVKSMVKIMGDGAKPRDIYWRDIDAD